MKRFFRILMIAGLAIAILNLTSSQIASASTDPQSTVQQTKVTEFLHSVMPSATDVQLNNLANDPNFVRNVATVLDVKVSRSVFSTRGACTRSWSKIQSRGLFGTLFSFKLILSWCYDAGRVTSHSNKVVPDVTMYGSAFGWAYKGEYQARNTHYYTWNGHRYGGYVAEAFGEFGRCLGGNVGCIDQRFADVGVCGHYNGSASYIHKMN